MIDDAPPTGHVNLARKAFDEEHGDRFWLESREFSRWEAWVDVIQLATFRPFAYRTAYYGTIALERGEFVASRRWLAARWRWSEKRVRIWIAKCENGARLRAIRETAAGTVYLIVNYDTYQGTGPSRGPVNGAERGPAGAQQGPKKEAVTTKLQKLAPAAPNGSWVSRFAEHWSSSVGTISPGQVGKGVKAAVDRHGEANVFRAMRSYIAVQKSAGKPTRFGWFATEVEVWVERSGGALEVKDGEMSPALELLTRPGR